MSRTLRSFHLSLRYFTLLLFLVLYQLLFPLLNQCSLLIQHLVYFLRYPLKQFLFLFLPSFSSSPLSLVVDHAFEWIEPVYSLHHSAPSPPDRASVTQWAHGVVANTYSCSNSPTISSSHFSRSAPPPPSIVHPNLLPYHADCFSTLTPADIKSTGYN